MGAPVDLEHVPPPPWLGEALSATPPPATGEADNLASGSDVGGLGGDLGDLGEAGNWTFNLTGAWGAATSQYRQSLIDGQSNWEEALRVFESVSAALADMQLGQINPWLPVLDRFAFKPLARKAGYDFSIAENVAAAFRAIPPVVLSMGGRHQELARLRARAEMGEMGSIAKGLAAFADWVRARTRRSD